MEEIITPQGGTVIQIPIEEEVKQAYIFVMFLDECHIDVADIRAKMIVSLQSF